MKENLFYTLEQYLLERKNMVILQKEHNKLDKEKFLEFKFNLYNLGFSIASDLEKTLKSLSVDSFSLFSNKIIPLLEKIKGVHVTHNVSLLHDIYSEKCFFPEYSDKHISLKIGTKNDLDIIFSNLVSSKTNISNTDKEFILTYISFYKGDIKIPVIANKEILSLVFKGLLCSGIELSTVKELLNPYIKTVTDILRLVTSLSNEINPDLSLKKQVKFHLTNSQRKFVMSSLEDLNYIEEDMLRYINRWKVIGKLLHIGSYKSKYPKTFKAFDTIRNKPKSVRSFYSKVKSKLAYLGYIKSQKKEIPTTIESLLSLLKSRPGEFARNLDLLLRKNNHQDLILSNFEEVVDSIATTVLLQLKGHFKNRNDFLGKRDFLSKDNFKAVETDKREFIPINFLNKLLNIIDSSLTRLYSKKESLGTVYVDPYIKNFLIPSSLRNTNSSKDVITRGSTFDGTDKNYIRLFVYWKNKYDKIEEENCLAEGEEYNGERVDIDLSAIGFDENWDCKGYLDYTSLYFNDSYHSEDIVDAPHGATEFIDINKESFINKNIRYVCMLVYSYTEHNFNELECFAGLMERNSICSDELYDPKLVSLKFDICSERTQSLPLIYDLVENKIIWCDIDSENVLNRIQSVNNTKGLVSKIGSSLISYKDKKVNLLELIKLHSNRGTFHFEKQEDVDYDLIIDKNFCFNIDEIVSKWI